MRVSRRNLANRAWAAFVVAAAVFPVLPAVGQGRGANAARAEPVLLDVRVSDSNADNVASSTLQATRTGDTLLLPTRDICALAEIRCTDPTPSDITLRSVATLLNAHVSVDWEQLTVLITNCDACAVVQRHARAMAHATLARSPSTKATPDHTVRSPGALTPSLHIDYTMFAASSSLSRATHSVRLGYAAFRGITTAQVALTPPILHGARWLSLQDISWRRAWHDRSIVRQLQIGDIPAGTGIGQLRGIRITNTPFAPTSGVDSIRVSLVTTPLNETEVFRGGTLIAAGQADSAGSYTVWAPSMYGANNFTFASYDQYGAASHTYRSILVEPGMLAAHALRYAIAAGRCVIQVCRSGADLEVSFAPSTRLTASLSADAFDRNAGRLAMTTRARIIAHVTDALSTSVTRTGNSLTSTAAHFAPSPTLDMRGEYRSGRPQTGTISGPYSYARSAQREASMSGTWRPRRSGVHPSFVAQFATRRSGAYSSTAARLGIALPTALAYVAPFAHYSHASIRGADPAARPIISVGMDALVTRLRGPFPLSCSTLRLHTETAPVVGQPASVASISLPLVGTLRVDVQAQWKERRPAISLLVRQQIGGFRMTSTVDLATPQQPHAQHTLDASLVLDGARRRITTGAWSSAGTALINGIVFVDQNRNGRLDAGELPIAGAYVRSGDTGALSDSLGRYELNDVTPFAPTTLQIDPLTLPSPSLVPLYPTIRAEPVPDEILRVDVPVVEAPL